MNSKLKVIHIAVVSLFALTALFSSAAAAQEEALQVTQPVPVGTPLNLGDKSPSQLFEMIPAAEEVKKAPPAPAVNSVQEKEKQNILETDLLHQKGGYSILRTLVVSIFVCSLIVLIAYVYSRKAGVRQGGRKTNQKSARIVQMIPFGVKRQIAVIDFEGQRILVGVTSESMQVLQSVRINDTQGMAEVAEAVENRQVVSSEPKIQNSGQRIQKRAHTEDSPALKRELDIARKVKEKISQLKNLQESKSRIGSRAMQKNRFSDELSRIEDSLAGTGMDDGSSVINYSRDEGFSANDGINRIV